ncbi:unnamed protein product [Pleuronectes platessa]|uniref:Uncharacterized protein n=1 Tax=Pleuronectes platessa TaxID=8262 RepID=A0A9N7UBU3_PLEPL|nr:unnamed protein product [Pleuronectes platessa]
MSRSRPWRDVGFGVEVKGDEHKGELMYEVVIGSGPDAVFPSSRGSERSAWTAPPGSASRFDLADEGLQENTSRVRTDESAATVMKVRTAHITLQQGILGNTDPHIQLSEQISHEALLWQPASAS